MTPEDHCIQRCIGEVAKNFSGNPYDFLYETDIRAALYGLLKDSPEFPRHHVSNEAVQRFKFGTSDHVTSPVRMEYPTGTRFDIAITGRDDARGLWMQPVRFAFELKLWQIDHGGNCFVKDLLKIAHHQRNSPALRGWVIVFAHSDNVLDNKLKSFKVEGIREHLTDRINASAMLELVLVTPGIVRAWTAVDGNSGADSLSRLCALKEGKCRAL